MPADRSAQATAEAPTAATSGIDLAGIDTAVKPGDDFDEYANGAWKRATEIPADRASLSTGFYVFEKAEKRLSDLVQGLDKTNPAAGSDARKIADYYAAWMDEAGIEARGLVPLQPKLDGIAAIADKAALSRWLGAGMRADTDPLNATILVVFLVAAFWHARLGVQVVIEDYVHAPLLAGIAHVANLFVCALATIAGVLAVVRIALGA